MFFKKAKLKKIKDKTSFVRDCLYRRRDHLLLKLIKDDSLTTKDVIYLTTDIYDFLLEKLKEIEEDLDEC
jgi:hypothetical protein